MLTMADEDNDDYLLALSLSTQHELDDANEEVASLVPEVFRKKNNPGKVSTKTAAEEDPRSQPRSKEPQLSSIVAPEWEDLDPTPDLHALFIQFNDRFFWGKLSACEVKWSPRMTLCAGVCSYSPAQGLCSVRLSLPLLKLRPRRDLVETLLHEMIHAYLFVTDGDDDHDGHGPAFHEHMYRINREAGTKISVYHTFHDEVASYQRHWWKCDGPCSGKKPFYGMVKRSMNRAPGPNDLWWKDHQLTCGGTFTKVQEPEGYQSKKSKGQALLPKGQRDIRSFGTSNPEAAPHHSSSGRTSEKRPWDKENDHVFGDGSPGKTSNDIRLATINMFGSKIHGFVAPLQVPSKRPKKNPAGLNSQTPSAFKPGSAEQNKGDQVITLSDSPIKVREPVKEAWAKLFGQPSSGNQRVSSTVGSISAQANLYHPPEAECPICGRNYPLQRINAHLDECLSNQEVVPSVAALPNYSICPICGLKFRSDLIEAHANSCIDVC